VHRIVREFQESEWHADDEGRERRKVAMQRATAADERSLQEARLERAVVGTMPHSAVGAAASVSMSCARLILGTLFLVLAGCVTRSLPKPAPQSIANPETSYKLITPPDAPHYTLQPGQSASLPVPEIGHFAPPVYPASLAHPGMSSVVVKAQLVFGSDGRVSEVVILSDSCTGAGHTLFEDAVRAAAKGWAFTPLVFEQSVGGGDTPVTFRREAEPFSLWFEFRFDMANGKPVVQTVKR
jgi:hypothetical protein